MPEFDYRKKLNDDLLEQFRRKPNISIVMASYARQLQEVHDFLRSLLTVLDLEKCVGKQLDLIGEIVVMSRYDARVALDEKYEGEVLDDDLYRTMLKYKIFRNTSNGTYWDVKRGIAMFWKLPLHYSTELKSPATIILQTDVLPPDTELDTLIRAPIVRAAGVDIRLTVTTQDEERSDTAHIGGAICRLSITQLPEIEMGLTFDGNFRARGKHTSASVTDLPEIKMDFDFKSELKASGRYASHHMTELPELKMNFGFSDTVRVSGRKLQISVTALPPLYGEVGAMF